VIVTFAQQKMMFFKGKFKHSGFRDGSLFQGASEASIVVSKSKMVSVVTAFCFF